MVKTRSLQQLALFHKHDGCSHNTTQLSMRNISYLCDHDNDGHEHKYLSYPVLTVVLEPDYLHSAGD